MKLTLGKKLGLGFATILTLMVLSSVVSHVKLAVVEENQDLAFSLRVPSLDIARQLQRDLNQASSKGRQAILAGEDRTRREAAKKLSDDAWSEGRQRYRPPGRTGTSLEPPSEP